MIKRPILRIYGGKWRIAPWIIEHFPDHQVYVEPYGGAASVLLRKPRSQVEVYNDLFGDIVTVFRVLRDPKKAAELERLIRLTPFAREEFNDAHQSKREKVKDSVELARRTLFRSMSGFLSAGLQANSCAGFRRSTIYGKRYAIEWMNYPQNINAFTERLKGVIIEHQSAEETILDYDGKETLFYIDPPFPYGTRNMDHGNAHYVHDMSDDDHRRLAELLRSVQGKVLISGYPCDLYDKELYPDWKRITRRNYSTGNGRKGSASPRTEVLWIKPGSERKGLL